MKNFLGKIYKGCICTFFYVYVAFVHIKKTKIIRDSIHIEKKLEAHYTKIGNLNLKWITEINEKIDNYMSVGWIFLDNLHKTNSILRVLRFSLGILNTDSFSIFWKFLIEVNICTSTTGVCIICYQNRWRNNRIQISKWSESIKETAKHRDEDKLSPRDVLVLVNRLDYPIQR